MRKAEPCNCEQSLELTRMLTEIAEYVERRALTVQQDHELLLLANRARSLILEYAEDQDVVEWR